MSEDIDVMAYKEVVAERDQALSKLEKARKALEQIALHEGQPVIGVSRNGAVRMVHHHLNIARQCLKELASE